MTDFPKVVDSTLEELDKIAAGLQGSAHYGHRHVAEKALGKALPKGAVVHHVDGDPRNHKNSNLVICPSENYHNLIHLRTNALLASGNANYVKCYICKTYDDPSRVVSVPKPDRSRTTTFYHKRCRSIYRRHARKQGLSV